MDVFVLKYQKGCKMKSIKPGRGPSGMSFIGSIAAVIFGVIWTAVAFSMAASFPFDGITAIFPLFGIIFVIVGIVQAVYHYKNATGKYRYSLFDITDSSEEGDPADKWVNDRDSNNGKEVNREYADGTGFNYCPYCGFRLESSYIYCPKCGKTINS